MTSYLGAKHWRPAVLQDLVHLQRGFDITKDHQKEGDVPVISSSGPSSWHNEAMAVGPGVVIGRKAHLALFTTARATTGLTTRRFGASHLMATIRVSSTML